MYSEFIHPFDCMMFTKRYYNEIKAGQRLLKYSQLLFNYTIICNLVTKLYLKIQITSIDVFNILKNILFSFAMFGPIGKPQLWSSFHSSLSPAQNKKLPVPKKHKALPLAVKLANGLLGANRHGLQRQILKTFKVSS